MKRIGRRRGRAGGLRFWAGIVMAVALGNAGAFAIPAAAQPTSLSVSINGQPVAFQQPPVDRGGRIFVPLRGVFERLGASVVYDAGRINATKGTTTISLAVGSTSATVNGQPEQLDSPPFSEAGTTFVPLRFISQALGATVRYDASAQTVTIGTPPGRRALRFPQGR